MTGTAPAGAFLFRGRQEKAALFEIFPPGGKAGRQRQQQE